MSLTKLAHREPVAVDASMSVFDVLKIMVDKHTGAVGVTESGRLVGIFTERDVVKVAVQELDVKSTPVSQVMTRNIKTASDETKITDALNLMSNHRIRHLPIVDENGEMQSMVSLRFIMHDRLQYLLKELDGLQSYLCADGPGG
jgi:CBS domain-containing protein